MISNRIVGIILKRKRLGRAAFKGLYTGLSKLRCWRGGKSGHDCVRVLCGNVTLSDHQIVRLSDCSVEWPFRGCLLVSRGTKGQVCLRCLPMFGNQTTSDVHALLEKETSFLREIGPFEIFCILKSSWNWGQVSKISYKKYLTYFVNSCEDLTFNLDYKYVGKGEKAQTLP